MKSVIQKERECYICGRTEPLQVHHCFEGAYRAKAEEYGGKMYLCCACHIRAHENETMLQFLRERAQKALMNYYGWTEEEFRQHIGRSFL